MGRLWFGMAFGGFAACTGDDSTTPTPLPRRADVAILNAGRLPVDVVLTSTDAETVLFEEVLPLGATPFREVAFTSLDGVLVSCETGCVDGTVDLSATQPNTILVSPDGPPVWNPADITPPELLALAPADGATDVARNTPLIVTFSEPMAPATITAQSAGGACTGAIQLSADGFASCVALGSPVSEDATRFVVVPAAPLEPTVAYQVKVGADAVDVSGLGLFDEAVSGFETGLTLDETGPLPITDLAVASVTDGSVALRWTAVGDDGDQGAAASYDVRYAAGPCPFVFEDATRVSGEPAPALAGASETFELTGLPDLTLFCFAVRVADDVLNDAGDSNFVSATTQEDLTPPSSPVLAMGNPTSSAIPLTWTAVGDNGEVGTATAYDLRYEAGGPCPAHDETTFFGGTVVSPIAAPQPAGSAEAIAVSGLDATTTYCFVLRVSDDRDNASFSEDVVGSTADIGGGGGFW